MTKTAPFWIADFLRALLCEGIDELLGQPAGHEDTAACLEEILYLLGALPLDTTEFGLALNRLANAWHYLESGEHGAAQYELRLLRRSLEQ
jgi:hypothetical protein